MDTTPFKKLRRHRHLVRLMGFVWALVGGLLLLSVIPLVLDPAASIVYNGSPTTEFWPKLSAALFAGGFLVVGLCFLFVPGRFLDRLYVWHQSALSSLAFWRK
jgi:hypothetical protein